MKRQDDGPDSSKPATSAEEAPPRAAFEPPVRDPSVLAILKGLNPSVTPVPMQIATTDGELAASFAAAPRGVAHGDVTPLPEASVVVRESTPEPGRVKVARGSGKKGSRENLDTTFRLRGVKTSATLPVLAATVLVGVAVAVWWNRGGGVPAAAVPTRATRVLAPVLAPTPAPLPHGEPSPSPASPIAATSVATAPPAPIASSAPAPAVVPSAKPTQAAPPQTRQHELLYDIDRP